MLAQRGSLYCPPGADPTRAGSYAADDALRSRSADAICRADRTDRRPIRIEQLLQRVRERCRPSEQTLKLEFLDALRQRFDEWATAWIRSPIVVVSADLDVRWDGEMVRGLGESVTPHLYVGWHPMIFQQEVK